MRALLGCAIALSVVSTSLAAHADAVARIYLGDATWEKKLVAAYTKAVGLKPLDVHGGDQVRIWFVSLMRGKVTGYLVAKDGVQRCMLTFKNEWRKRSDHSTLIVQEGQCQSTPVAEATIQEALQHLPEALKFNGGTFDCEGFEDGWEARVEGVAAGQRFNFYASNTDHCPGQNLEPVDAWLDIFMRTYKEEG